MGLSLLDDAGKSSARFPSFLPQPMDQGGGFGDRFPGPQDSLALMFQYFKRAFGYQQIVSGRWSMKGRRRQTGFRGLVPAEISVCEPRVMLAADIDPANDVPAGASRVTAVQDMTFVDGSLSAADSVDWYRFILTSEHDVRVSLSNLTADANLVLQDAGGQVFAVGNQAGTADELVEARLPSGDYFVRLTASATTDYRLGFEFLDPTVGSTGEPFNSVMTGAELIPAAGRQVIDSLISFGDPADWYTFTLADRETLEIRLSGLTDDVNLVLKESDGTNIRVSANRGTTDELIRKALPAGTYFLRVVSSIDTISPYRLAVTFDENFTDEPVNNTLAGASNIEVADETKVNSALTPDDPVDWYQFTVGSETDVTLTLDKMRRNLDLVLTDDAGTPIETSEEEITTAEVIEATLDPGTYFVRVARPLGTPFGFETPYRLTAAFVGTLVGEPDNDTAGGAQTLVVPETRISALTVGDRADWYRFELDVTTSVQIALSDLEEDLTLVLFDTLPAPLEGQLRRLNRSRNPDTQAESITRTLSAGEYFIRVVRAGDLTTETEYTLTLT